MPGGTGKTVITELTRLLKKSLMPGDCTTCTAMCGSGATIGIIKTIIIVPVIILQALNPAMITFCVAAVGPITPATADQPTDA